MKFKRVHQWITIFSVIITFVSSESLFGGITGSKSHSLEKNSLKTVSFAIAGMT